MSRHGRGNGGDRIPISPELAKLISQQAQGRVVAPQQEIPIAFRAAQQFSALRQQLEGGVEETELALSVYPQDEELVAHRAALDVALAEVIRFEADAVKKAQPALAMGIGKLLEAARKTHAELMSE